MKKLKQSGNLAMIVAAVALMLQMTSSANAQDSTADQGSQSAQAGDQDAPGRVARLNYIDGSVSFQPGGENDWVDAALNRPLVTGDNLWTDENSRAEVHIGSTALRLGEKTGISFLEVSDHASQIRLVQGSLIANVRHVDDEDSYEIDTPNVAFAVMQPGDYRIDVDPSGGRTDVTVWRGRGQVTGGGSSYSMVADQFATFTGSDRQEYDLSRAPDHDGLDNWASERDRQEDDSDSANYVSRDMTGYEDLDTYGDWSYVSYYGYVWRPRGVSAGWAPYRSGNWVWVRPWGWTWVAEEPWGFAPFHYGRWAFEGNGWVWVPGPSVARPVYAPALVGWIGGRSALRGGVGWVPLAPGEVFVPGYRASLAYVNRVNVTNTTVNNSRVTNVYNTVVVNRSANDISYANRNLNGGVTVVSRDTFVNARPVAGGLVSVSSVDLAAAPVSNTVAVEPARASVLGSGKPVVNRPPAAVTSRTVVAVRTPAPMPRSFAPREMQTGGHLNQPLPTQSLVRQEPSGTPVPLTPVKRQPSQPVEGLHPVSEGASSIDNPVKPQPRVWEEQGTPEPEVSRSQQVTQSAQPAHQQSSRAVVKPVAPVQKSSSQPQRQEEEKYSAWHSPTQKPATTATTTTQAQQSSHSTTQAHSTTAPVSAPPKK